MAQEKLPAFETCACGTHGRLVDIDGRTVMEVYSQKLARLALAGALRKGLIEARHCAMLQRQIHASGLPPCNDGIPRSLALAVGEWNSAPRTHDAASTPCFKEPPP
jgi:hypothetical protein